MTFLVTGVILVSIPMKGKDLVTQLKDTLSKAFLYSISATLNFFFLLIPSYNVAPLLAADL
jgi:hypothetical protein